MHVHVLAVWLLSVSACLAGGFPKFEHKTVDPHCGNVCYAVALADVDGDGKQDIVAVTENRVLWYQAPNWTKRVIVEDQTIRDNVCIASHDIDGDGKIDFALGAGWTKVGTIQWLSRGKSLDEKWNVHFIGKSLWLHRMRFADVDRDGKAELVISPLNATGGRKGVELTAFSIPKNPRSERWPADVMDATLNRMHNHWHVDLDGDKSTDTLTASREGIHLIRKDRSWMRTKLSPGIRGKTPNDSGAGEIKTGRLSGGATFIATVEPMHGTHAVVYTRIAGIRSESDGRDEWKRLVLDDSLKRGHAIWCADVDGDGADEIVVGHSNTRAGEKLPRGVYVYDAQDAAGTKWTRHVIDEGGVAVEDLVAADLTGDGKIDIVAGGRYTHNIKLYVNRPSE